MSFGWENYLPQLIWIHVFLFLFSTEQWDKWVGFLCEPCFIYYHCSLHPRHRMHYLHSLHSTFSRHHVLYGVWQTFNGKWKELFLDACLWWEALFIVSKRRGWIEGERENQSLLPNIRLKPTKQENSTDSFMMENIHYLHYMYFYYICSVEYELVV